jgi:hypothetical protein
MCESAALCVLLVLFLLLLEIKECSNVQEMHCARCKHFIDVTTKPQNPISVVEVKLVEQRN